MRIVLFWALGCALFAGIGRMGGVPKAYADTGNSSAYRVAVGSQSYTSRTAINATTVTNIAAFRLDRPDLTCFNNSSVYIFISSAGAAVAHYQVSGFIVLSSATFSMGAHLGAVGALTNSGDGEVRCWEGRTES